MICSASLGYRFVEAIQAAEDLRLVGNGALDAVDRGAEFVQGAGHGAEVLGLSLVKNADPLAVLGHLQQRGAYRVLWQVCSPRAPRIVTGRERFFFVAAAAAGELGVRVVGDQMEVRTRAVGGGGVGVLPAAPTGSGCGVDVGRVLGRAVEGAGVSTATASPRRRACR